MSFPRYPAYKDSGVEWLGNVPEHWGVDRLKSVISIKKNTVGADSADFKLLSLTLKGVIPRDLDNPQGKFPTDFDGYQAVQPNDLIFCLFDVEETPRAVGIARETGMVTGAYTVGEVKAGHCSDFIHYFYLSRDQYKALKMYYTGLRNVIRKENFYDIPCPLPPPIEQQKIAAFLDRETAKIDALVAEQEQLITLLKEKRQAVISHAVTKGLDSSVPMKDSGVEWLGEVPAHWDVKRLRHVVLLNPSKSETVGLSRATEVSFLAMESIGEDGALSLDRIRPIGEVEVGYTYFREGDVAIAKITPCFENGKGAVMRGLHSGIGFGTTELIVARPKADQILSDYLFHIFKSSPFKHQGEACMYGAGGQKRLPDDFVRDFSIGIPPVDEQEQIHAFLTQQLIRFDELTNEAAVVTRMLLERRSALISAAVTGQIDVRAY